MIQATDMAVRKFHGSLNVTDLERSVAFYRVLFGQEPTKHHSDYAKFELGDPPLVLSLNPAGESGGRTVNHFGLRMLSSAELVEIQKRLEAAGYPTQREEGVACCYALQTKLWISDPDSILWEVYTLHEDLEQRGDGVVPEAAALARTAAIEKRTWEHHATCCIPKEIPHDAESLDEVRCDGAIGSAGFDRLLAEAARVLKSGGLLRLQGAASNETVQDALDALRRAGFVSIQFETSSSARAMALVGRKGGDRSQGRPRRVVYLGPLARVVDDSGNMFVKGREVTISQSDWNALEQSGLANQFQCFQDAALPVMQGGCCGS